MTRTQEVFGESLGRWRGRVLAEAAAVGVALTLASFGAAWLLLGWSTAEANPLEVAAVLTSYSCTYLCVVQSRMNYPIGIVTTALYSWLFLSYGLPGSAAANAYLVVALIYGWFRWGPDDDTRRPTWILSGSPIWVVAHLGVAAILYFGARSIYELYGELPNPSDQAILALTILAQLLLDNKRTETWFVWIAVNVLAISVYATAGLPLAAIQYVFFLINAPIGLYAWTRGARSATGSVR